MDSAFPQWQNDREMSAIQNHMDETTECKIMTGIFDHLVDFQVLLKYLLEAMARSLREVESNLYHNDKGNKLAR